MLSALCVHWLLKIDVILLWITIPLPNRNLRPWPLSPSHSRSNTSGITLNLFLVAQNVFIFCRPSSSMGSCSSRFASASRNHNQVTTWLYSGHCSNAWGWFSIVLLFSYLLALPQQSGTQSHCTPGTALSAVDTISWGGRLRPGSLSYYGLARAHLTEVDGCQLRQVIGCQNQNILSKIVILHLE